MTGVWRAVNPWSVWLTATVGSFAAVEARALVRRDIPTLSECLARWAGLHPRRRHGVVVPLLFVAGCGWLVVHVATWQGPKSLSSLVEEAAV